MIQPSTIRILSRGRARHRVRPLALWCAAFAISILLGATAYADFMTGLAAYDAGDYRTAAKEWLPLAEQGDARAQVSMAGLYEAGLGVPRDYRAAAQWYRAAAAQGDAIAALNLGSYYRRGFGVERDPAMAFYWFSVAAAAGNDWATSRRDAVGATLTPEQRQTAEKMLRGSGPPR